VGVPGTNGDDIVGERTFGKSSPSSAAHFCTSLHLSAISQEVKSGQVGGEL
jgi:hypothetical protein